MLLMTTIEVIQNKEIMMTKKEVLKGNTPVTEDSQYFSQGEMICRNEIVLHGDTKFHFFYLSNRILYWLQLVL